MRLFIALAAISCLHLYAEETAAGRLWDGEVQRRVDHARTNLEAEQLRWQQEQLAWAAEREAIKKQLDEAIKRNETATGHQWSKEMTEARRKAREDFQKREEARLKEEERMAQERKALEEKYSKEGYQGETLSSDGSGRYRSYSSTKTGSLEAAGMTRSTGGHSGGSAGYSREGSRGSSSTSIQSTTIHYDR